jgi:DNA-binding transcriptional regulator YhcF (GntR family)
VSGEQTGEGGGRKFWHVAEALRTRMTDGTYPMGSQLPGQRALALEFGVSRDTVQRVLTELAEDGWVASFVGSGTRVIRAQWNQTSPARTARPGQSVTLRSFIGGAFEQTTVALDVYTLTSESLDAHVRVQVERIRDREITPERITLRMLLPAESLELPYPRTKGDPEDQRLQKRLHNITKRHTSSLRGVLRDLQIDGLVPSVDVEIRHARLTPTFKLYVLNRAEALFGPYPVIERTIEMDDLEEVTALDVLGFGATLTHHVTDEEPTSQGSVFVASMQYWFDSIWQLGTEEG